MAKKTIENIDVVIRALGTISHDGIDYVAGDQFTCHPDDAERLLKMGVAEIV